MQQAWPLIVANASTPLLGLADSAALGRFGRPEDLAAIALGALVFNFLYWGFNFLRMSTTAIVAQADGQRDQPAIVQAVLRAVLLGAAAGCVMVALQAPIVRLAFSLLQAEPTEELIASSYVRARIWGAPGALCTLGATGLLIGLGRFRSILVVQIVTNGLNILLDGVFVVVLGWGAVGVGWGTACAEWTGAVLSLLYVRQALRAGDAHFRWGAALATAVRPGGWRATLTAQRDLLLRTLAMIVGFSFFTNAGAQFGTAILAGNHLLLQYVALSAFFLDGFAHVAETHLGRALGARDPLAFEVALRKTSEVALICSLLLGAGILLGGTRGLRLLTRHESVVYAAAVELPWAAAYVACSVIAFQLDGVFIGTGRARVMRNMAWVSLGIFLVSAWWLTETLGNRGLWIAFVLYVVSRGLTLALRLPRLRRDVAGI